MHSIQLTGMPLKTFVAVATATLLSSCTDTSQMGFNATIKDLRDGRIELIATVSNNSSEMKTLSDIDIDSDLHKKLNLLPTSGLNGEFIPLDNTVSYAINEQLSPGQTYTFRLQGSKATQFITGDVDFIVNNDNFNFRSFPVSCCQ